MFVLDLAYPSGQLEPRGGSVPGIQKLHRLSNLSEPRSKLGFDTIQKISHTKYALLHDLEDSERRWVSAQLIYSSHKIKAVKAVN